MAARKKKSAGRWGAAADETASAALRRLLGEQLGVVRRNERQTRAGAVKALHDVRVALRRLRAIAETFQELAPSLLKKVDKLAGEVSDSLGKARDLDVWMALFAEYQKTAGEESMPVLDRREMLAGLAERRDYFARGALDSTAYGRLLTEVESFLDKPPARRERTAPPLRELAARQMLAVRALILERYRKVGAYSKEPAHDLRRAGRRMRYLNEFFGGLFGRDAGRAGRWITRAQGVLGKVHDCDNALELSKRMPPGAARDAVRRRLKQQRKAYVAQFKRSWKRYADRSLQQTWEARLQRALGGRAAG